MDTSSRVAALPGRSAPSAEAVAAGRVVATGSSGASVEGAVRTIAAGSMVVVLDSWDLPREGHLIMAADMATPETVNLMSEHGLGPVCAPMTGGDLQRLAIPPMTQCDSGAAQAAFHLSVDHASSRTGVSATDRARTLRALAHPDSEANDFRQPGHVFPLCIGPAGRGRAPRIAEVALDLVSQAGRRPVAFTCEVASRHGGAARLPELVEFARRHELPLVSVDDVVFERHRAEQVMRRAEEIVLQCRVEQFRMVGYRDEADGREHVALVLGDVHGAEDTLLHVHTECMVGDVFRSHRCDCRSDLETALQAISDDGRGVLVYVRDKDDRLRSLVDKLRAYADEGPAPDACFDPRLGHSYDSGDARVAALILEELGVGQVRPVVAGHAMTVGTALHLPAARTRRSGGERLSGRRSALRPVTATGDPVP